MQSTRLWRGVRPAWLLHGILLILLLGAVIYIGTSRTRLSHTHNELQNSITYNVLQAQLRLEAAPSYLRQRDRAAVLAILSSVIARIDSAYITSHILELPHEVVLDAIFRAYILEVNTLIESTVQLDQIPDTITADFIHKLARDIQRLNTFLSVSLSANINVFMVQAQHLCMGLETSKIRQYFLQEALIQQPNNSGTYTQDDCMKIN